MKVNSIIRKIRTVIKMPESILIKTLYTLSPYLSDKLYLKLLFPLKVGYKLNLDNPKSYNEKLQWLKLNYRDPLLAILADKYEYKKYIEKEIGEEYVPENYGVWSSFEEINFDDLPNKFVLKTTHDQGGVVICKDKSNFNIAKAQKKINKHLKRSIYYLMREWPYKYIKPRIIAEELLIDESGEDLKDYKFYCFNGEPVFMYISHGRQSDISYLDFYDMNFNHLNIERRGFSQSNITLKKPKNWDMMIYFAQRVSAGQPHVRIDFYNINGKILFGEYTLFQGGGMMPFYPRKWDYKFGEYLKLPKRNN